MPEPLWMSLILLVYVAVTGLTFVTAFIIRVFRVRPKGPRLLANAQILMNLKPVFGWATLGLFVFQMFYSMAVTNIESRVEIDIFNFMAWTFFLVLASAFYMLALWLLASALTRNLKAAGKGELAAAAAVETADGHQDYSAEEIAKETRIVRRQLSDQRQEVHWAAGKDAIEHGAADQELGLTSAKKLSA